MSMVATRFKYPNHKQRQEMSRMQHKLIVLLSSMVILLLMVACAPVEVPAPAAPAPEQPAAEPEPAPVPAEPEVVEEEVVAAPEITPSVTVEEQQVQGGTVTIARVVSAEPGWMVIHAEKGDKPGPVIGWTAVSQGDNSDVVVTIDTGKWTSTLFAMLHIDAGEVGAYEFPGADAPKFLDNNIVVVPFNAKKEPRYSYG